MDRRKNIKALVLGGMSIPFMQGCLSKTTDAKRPDTAKEGHSYQSNWHTLPDMSWPGPNYWANRLQDWAIKHGKLECLFQGKNRTVHCLTRQLGSSRNRFRMQMHLSLSPDLPASENNLTGFLLGAKSTFLDYRAAAIKGKGLKAGINTMGSLFIGDKVQPGPVVRPQQLQQGIVLEILAEPLGMKYALRLIAYDPAQKKVLGQLEDRNVEPAALEGNVAIISDINTVNKEDTPACSIEKWTMEGKKFKNNPSGALGPVCFTQYTQHQGTVKLTAQVMPVALPSTAVLEINTTGSWKKVADADIDYPSYTARFRLSGWKHQKAVPFRVGVELQGEDRNTGRYYYEGTIAEEPLKSSELRALVCSCNFDYGFPDQEVVDYASMHDPDLVMFLGDQFYEPNGGFGIQRAPLEKAYLDYLRKWYQFGWSYRELFRHRPVINLPDDHDVFQANLFGAGGQKVPQTSQRFKRDLGGFIMPPEWVNMVMTTQTSHMPDPYDPAPIAQGIQVFYTDWKYAGVSFGIIEDRKFKSGPAAILPEEAGVRDAFVMNDQYDVSRHSYPDASLVGDRQLRFLEKWVEDWGQGTIFKVLVSATPFHALQTLPEGADSNGHQRRLKVPVTGEYIEGDVPVADTDSGGWPQSQRDDLLRVIRKAFVVHLAGDQHLPSVTQYGVDDWGDAGVAFAVPALGNSWPRRWWPPVPAGHQPVPGKPPYTGNHTDAFGNKMHVMAVANPHQTGLEPGYLYDRSPGYGLVTFDKETREVKMECWPRYVNPRAEPGRQFKDWPLTVKQQDNFKPSDPHYLPALTVEGTVDPVIKVIDEATGDLVHILRIQGSSYQPKVRGAGTYTVVVEDTQRGLTKEITGLRAGVSQDKKQTVVL